MILDLMSVIILHLLLWVFRFSWIFCLFFGLLLSCGALFYLGLVSCLGFFANSFLYLFWFLFISSFCWGRKDTDCTCTFLITKMEILLLFLMMSYFIFFCGLKVLLNLFAMLERLKLLLKSCIQVTINLIGGLYFEKLSIYYFYILKNTITQFDPLKIQTIQ